MKSQMQSAILLVLAVLTAVQAQTLDKAKLDQLFDRLLEKNKGMGSLTLARDGHVLYSRSFGYSQVNGADQKPATAATKYRIGSITKTFTAVIIFQLIEEQKLKLGDTLDKFFPQVPNAGRITIGQLLSHRAGIPDLAPDGSWGRQSRTRDEVLARITEGKPEFEPDSRFKYSNTGYVLLGYIVEKVDGKSYPAILKDRITSKIGLKDLYAGVASPDASRNEALAYHYLGAWKEAAELDLSIPGGAGSILSTPADMATFIQALFALKLVSQDSLKQMMTLRDGEGMGLVPFKVAGKTFWGNSGGSGSSGAWLAYEPEEKLVLAYATNAKIYPVSNIVSGIFDIYWNRPYQIPALEALYVSPETLDRYVGVYLIAGTPAKMTVTRDGGALFIRAGEQQSTVPLEATAEDKFKIDPGVVFEFDAAKGELTSNRGGQKRVFTKGK